MADTNRLVLPLLSASQAQKHVTVNEALERLDAIVQLVVQSFSQDSPPATPQNGQVWAIGANPVNDWAGHPGELALWSNGGWLFIVPRAGWRAAMGTELRVWDGTAWSEITLPELQNLPGVGIGASFDGTNRLTVSADATLFTHDGGGHQVKINKAAAGDTAALLFQTGFSGRAEIGTLGSDGFGIKVSADGSAWQTALSVAPATGALSLGVALSPASGGTGVANDPAATLTRNGAHALTLTTTAPSAVTLPTGGTLATLSGTETLSNKTLTAPVLDGTVSGTAITQSTTDTTAGRLLRVGDFGVGRVLRITDFTAELHPGIYEYVESSSVGAPGDGSSFWGHCVVIRNAVGGVLVFASRGSAGSSARVWIGSRNGTTGAITWVDLYHAKNVLGTVSQSGGVPTGAIIERGSNANGQYTRFADGTQMCWHTLTTSSSAATTWTFPAAFTAAPNVTGCATATALSVVVQDSAPTTTAASFSARDKTDARRADSVRVQAIGRWF